jgi:hypothetical protein
MIYFSFTNVIYKGKVMQDEQIKYEFLNGWCHHFQSALCLEFPEAEGYEIFVMTVETNGEYLIDHQIVKYKGFFIDIRGIFTEDEMIEEHKKEYYLTMKKYHMRKSGQHTPINDYEYEIDCYLAKRDPDIKHFPLAYELVKQVEHIIRSL